MPFFMGSRICLPTENFFKMSKKIHVFVLYFCTPPIYYALNPQPYRFAYTIYRLDLHLDSIHQIYLYAVRIVHQLKLFLLAINLIG
jgi:hypothetical protein